MIKNYDLWDILTEIDEEQKQNREIEIENSNVNRNVYINRPLIFSNEYERAIESLGESKACTRNILTAARTMLSHHHGDKYEDLYFIDSETNKVLARTDYRVREQEVLPTKEMRNMAMNSSNIISIHNHPGSALPSIEDMVSCYYADYKYGIIACHGGTIYQYKTIGDLNRVNFVSECSRFYGRESKLYLEYQNGLITKNDYIEKHCKSFSELLQKLKDAGVNIREVLWNEKY